MTLARHLRLCPMSKLVVKLDLLINYASAPREMNRVRDSWLAS